MIMRQTKTLAAIAADIENGENMHEYYNENGAQIKAASKREQTQTGLQSAERERFRRDNVTAAPSTTFIYII